MDQILSNLFNFFKDLLFWSKGSINYKKQKLRNIFPTIIIIIINQALQG